MFGELGVEGGIDLFDVEFVLHPANDGLGREVGVGDDGVAFSRGLETHRPVAAGAILTVCGGNGIVSGVYNFVSGVTLEIGD